MRKIKIVMIILVSVLFLLVSMAPIATAADLDLFVVPGTGHQYAIDYNNNGTLYIWGGNIQTATGFKTLSATGSDIALEFVGLSADAAAEIALSILNDWYATLLAYDIVDTEVRVLYDSTTGKIKRVSPKIQ